MKQVIDESGKVIKGLFRTESGALVVKNELGLKQSIAQHTSIDSLNKEITQLKDQIALILETLNGKHSI
jgi:hypothetical protein